jgi:hypothetical protein
MAALFLRCRGLDECFNLSIYAGLIRANPDEVGFAVDCNLRPKLARLLRDVGSQIALLGQIEEDLLVSEVWP